MNHREHAIHKALAAGLDALGLVHRPGLEGCLTRTQRIRMAQVGMRDGWPDVHIPAQQGLPEMVGDVTPPAKALGDILEAYARAGDRQRMRTIASAVSDAYDAASSIAWAIGDEDRTHAEQALASMRRRLSTLRVAPAGTDAPALAEGSSRATVAGTPGGGPTSSASLPIHIPAMYRTFSLCGAVQDVDEVLDFALVTPTCPTCLVRAEAGWLPDAETCERWLARAEAGLVECGGDEDTGSVRVSRDMGEF